MTSRSLTIGFTKQRPLLIVHLEGYLAQLEVYKLKSQIEELLHEGFRFVILELTGVKYVDSAGVGSICHIHDKCNTINGLATIVVDPRSNIAQTLKLAGTDNIVDRFETIELAREEIHLRFGLNTNSTRDHSTGTIPPAPQIGNPAPQANPEVISRMDAILTANQASTAHIIQLLESLANRISNLDQRIGEIDRKITPCTPAEPKAS